MRRRRLLRLAAGLALIGLILGVGIGASRSSLESPAPTTWLADRDGHFLGVVAHDPAGRMGYWPLERRAWRMEAALLSIEDDDFWDHPGVDAIAVLRAAGQNVWAGRRVSGASTVAMQVARMQRPAARTWSAKIAEAAGALGLVARNGRRAVLDQYLRLAPYGNNIHGIAFAARWYFDKPAHDLSWAETAFLAAIPQSPGRMNPYDPEGRRRASTRAARILDRLRTTERIDAKLHALAMQSLPTVHVRPRPARASSTLHALLELARSGRAGVVRTTFDLPLQEALTGEIRAALTQLAEDGAENAAAMVVDLEDWSVRASIGSADWDASTAGALDYTRTPRSPGSTLKPFLFAQALEGGLIEATTPLDDLGRAGDAIGNADARFMGPLLPAAALGNSRNVPAVSLVQRLGVGRVFAHYRRLGLHADPALAERYGLGLAIGALPVRMVDLVGAYTALAGDGRQRPLRWLRDAPRSDGRHVFSAATARQTTAFLSDAQARLPGFPRLAHSELPFPVALKTGTSASYRDAWAIAWTPRYLVAVWVGRPDWRPMRKVSGYRVGHGLLMKILKRLHPEAHVGLSDVGFPGPEDHEPATVCALSGHAPGPSCHRHATVWRSDAAPELTPCPHHVTAWVDVRTGGPATADTARAFREERRFLDLPGRYAAWMTARGLKPPPGRAGSAGPLRQGHAPTLRIVSPRPGSELIRDPEAAIGFGTVALQAAVDPPGAEILWTIDGHPLALAGPPYTLRWPLEPGSHVIGARVPYTDVATEVRIVAR